MPRPDVVLARRTEIGRRVDALSLETLRGLAISIHEALWDPASDDYPDAPVSGTDFVDAVIDAFRYACLLPKSSDLLCAGCCVDEHDTCMMVDGCPCCDDTRRKMLEAP